MPKVSHSKYEVCIEVFSFCIWEILVIQTRAQEIHSLYLEDSQIIQESV